VYGTELLTPLAISPAVRAPILVALLQLSAVMLPTVTFTVRLSVQLCPPKLSAKLAVPLPLGVPVIT
jgi:hypothetical protein